MGAHARRQRIFIRNPAVDDLGQLRRAAPVVRVGDHAQRFAAVPLLHDERSGADRLAVVRDLVEIVVLGEQVLRKDGVRRRGHREERVDERREGPREVDDDRVGVRRVDRAHLVVPGPRLHVRVRIHHGVPREHDVVGGERRAVLPLHAPAQMVGDRASVLRDPAVRKRRHLGRQLRDEFVAVAIIEEIAGPEHREVDVELELSEQRVQCIGVAEGRDSQDPRTGPGMPRGA